MTENKRERIELERRRLYGLLACKREELSMYVPGFFMRRTVEAEIYEIQEWLLTIDQKSPRSSVVFRVIK